MATARDRYHRKAYSEPLDKGRAAAAEADMAEAFEDGACPDCGYLHDRECAPEDLFEEPDWVTPDAEELAHMEAAERDHEHELSGWRRRPGQSQAAKPKGYAPPVDAEGFQCGMCLLNRRQCMACARAEAEQRELDGVDEEDRHELELASANRYDPGDF